MRERAKLYKTQSNKKDFSLSKRLGQEEVKDEVGPNNTDPVAIKFSSNNMQQFVSEKDSSN
jgi:hypothetical protein